MAQIDSSPIQRVAGGDLSARAWRFGKETSAGVVACTVAGERADGIIGSGFPKPPKVAGDAVDVYVERLIKVEAGGAFNGGDPLTTDNVGRAVLAGAGDHINAIATEPATAAGQIVGIRAPYSRGPSTGLAVVNAPLAPALAASGAEVVIAIDIPDAPTTTYSYVNAERLEVTGITVIKDQPGAAGNTIQLKTAGGTAISDAIAAVGDKAVTSAGSLDKAQRTLAAGAGFQITAIKVGGSMACQVFLHAIKRP